MSPEELRRARQEAKAASDKEQAEWVAKHKAVRVSLNAELVRRVAFFVAKDDIRFYLNGMCIERAPQGGVFIIGTDGHTMGIAHDAEASLKGADRIIIKLSPGLIQSLRPVRGKADPRLIVDGLRVSVAGDFGQQHTDAERFVQCGQPFIRGEFPDWKKALPDFEAIKPACAASVNTKYLARLYEVAKTSRHSNYSHWCSVRLWQDKPSGVIAAQYETRPEFLALVMPMRENYVESEALALMAAFKPAKAAAPAPEEAPA